MIWVLTMKSIRRVSPVVGALALSVILSACSTVRGYLGGTDNSEPPAELVDFTPELKIDEVWSRSIGAGVSKYYLKLRPMIAEGRIYAADRKGSVSAYNADSGDQIWETDTDVAVSGGPGGGGGLILVGSSDGDVVALAADTGEEIWRARVSSEVLAAPSVADGVAVVRTIDGKLGL